MTFILGTTFNLFSQSSISSWVGIYHGEMILGYTGKVSDTIHVDFKMEEIEKDSSWSYSMKFKSEVYGDITKDYLIKSKTKGDTVNFLLDEQNGLIMEESFMNNCLYGMYEVMGQIYINTMRKTDYGIFFELICAPLKNPHVTTTDEAVSEEAIEVKSYKPFLHQSVKLIKQ